VLAIWKVTHPDYGLVRRHGHNADTWDIRGANGANAASDRSNYDYPQDELVQWPKAPSAWPPSCPTRMSCSTTWKTRGQPNAPSLMDVMGSLPPA